MSLLPVDKTPSMPKIKKRKITWQENFKRDLYRTNYQEILKNKSITIQSLNKRESQNRCLKNMMKCLESGEYRSLLRREISEKPYESPFTPYSNYIPLESESFLPDELMNTFPYLKHLAETTKQHKTHYEIIQSYFQDQSTKKKVLDVGRQWLRTKRKYLCPLDAVQSVAIFVYLTRKGFWVMGEMKQQFSPDCLKEVFNHRVYHSVKYLRETNKIYKNMKVSVELGEQLSLKTISAGNKTWYCSICMIYDCGRHVQDLQSVKHGEQYVSYRNRIDKEHHIQSILRIYKAYNIFRKSTEEIMIDVEDEKDYCSPNCYKGLNKTKILQNQNKKNLLNEPITKVLIEMGIELFSYNPCMIWNLLNNKKKTEKKDPKQITCSLIFIYLMEDGQLLQKINNKLKPNEVSLLVEEQTREQEQIEQPIKVFKKRNANLDYLQKRVNSRVTEIPICMHNFIDGGTIDPCCERCPCNQRGFCLPSCLCTPSCKIKRIPCVCKDGESCETNKCVCFSKKLECEPGLCHNCFANENQPKKNKCRNDQILRRQSKKILVGISNIPGAGLGAFAGQNYLKNDLVAVYSGENIHSSVDGIRQCMMKVLSFYNFDSPNLRENMASIDARFMGNKTRFINHGNQGETNMHSQIVFSHGTEYIGLYALRDIRAGQELKFDYDGNGQLFKNHRDKYPFIKQKKRLN